MPIQSGFRRNLTSLRAPSHRIVEATRRDHFSLQDITPEEDWENIDFSARPEPYSGGYEAIIIGITLLILCLIVIAVIFILALYRLRKIRLLGRCRNRSRPVDNSTCGHGDCDLGRAIQYCTWRAVSLHHHMNCFASLETTLLGSKTYCNSRYQSGV